VTLIDQLRDRNIGFRLVCAGAIDTATPPQRQQVAAGLGSSPLSLTMETSDQYCF
jgi:hypothetical protein